MKTILIAKNLQNEKIFLYDVQNIAIPLNEPYELNIDIPDELGVKLDSIWKLLPRELFETILEKIIWFYFFNRCFSAVLKFLMLSKPLMLKFLRKFYYLGEIENPIKSCQHLLASFISIDDAMTIHVRSPHSENYFITHMYFKKEPAPWNYYRFEVFDEFEKPIITDTGTNYKSLQLGDFLYDTCFLKGISYEGITQAEFVYTPVLIFQFFVRKHRQDLDCFQSVSEFLSNFPLLYFVKCLKRIYGPTTGIFLCLEDELLGNILHCISFLYVLVRNARWNSNDVPISVQNARWDYSGGPLE